MKRKIFMNSFFDSLLKYFGYKSWEEWFLQEAIWAITSIVIGIVAWFVFHHYIRPRLGNFSKSLIKKDETRDLGIFIGLLDTKFFDFSILILFGSIVSIGIFSIIGFDVTPIISYLTGGLLSFVYWFFSEGIIIFVMILVLWILIRIVRRIVPKIVTSFVLGRAEYGEHDEAEKEANTLSKVFTGGAVIIILITGLFMILTKLEIPVGPILAGFGVAGIAVGFGAQHVVRDIISGIFIIAENQYRTGDVVGIAGQVGFVEDLNLRRTILRDLEGTVHVIPNGEVTVSSNRTKNYSRVVLDVGVAYKENLERVIFILNQIGNEIAADPVFGLYIITAPQVLRIQSFDDSAITIKMMGDCKPMKQWQLRGELLRRIKARFDLEGIEIPFPHQTVYWGVDQPSLTIQEKTPSKNNKKSSSKTISTKPEDIEQMLAQIALAKRGSIWNEKDIDE